MFAGLNVLRVAAMKSLKVDQFEFSQTYLQFYDKLEKANWFLETMIATSDEPTDGRLISFLLQDPIQDGGQWDMFTDLVRKYGVVPKTAMPDAESSGESTPMNGVLRAKLREYAAELRRRKAGGAGRRRAARAARTRCWPRSIACWPSTWAGRRASSTGSGATQTTSSIATACITPRAVLRALRRASSSTTT